MSHSDYSQLPSQIRRPVKACESRFQQLFQSAPLLSLHARFAFETLGKIGEGGMGSVYQVKDHRLKRIAALKLLSDKNATDHARLRFFREAQITAGLDHPAIPPVYETGLTADGDLYMLMRMIRGKTLRQVIEECHELGSMERRELIEIMIKVAEAVAYAHSQGVIHRDLKPDNIMVGEFGEVLVIDWGIAKDLQAVEDEQADKVLECVISKSELEQVGVTVTGTMVGTPGYMAPEQIDGVSIDERADVFALGLILVEILTGKRAVSGDTTIDRVAVTASGSALTPRDIDSSLPREIDWVVKEAMEVEADSRTQRAEDLVAQLRAYLSGDEIPGYSYSLIERVQRMVKRRPGLIVATTVGALLLALIGNLWLTLELEGQKRQKAEANVVVAKTKLGVAEDEAETAKAVLLLFNEARNLVERGAPKQRLKEKIDEALKRGGRTENQLLTASRIYFDANYYKDSKTILEEAVKRFSPCYEGLFSLHLCELKLLNRGFFYTSFLENLLSESKKRGQENEFTLYAEGQQFVLAGRFEEAIAEFSKIEQYSSRFTWMYVSRASLWKEKGELDKALDDLNRAIELDSRLAAAFAIRGEVWERKGDLDKSLADLMKSLEIKPQAAVFSMRGAVWERKGEIDKALADYSRAIEINPRSAMTLTNRGIIYYQRGKLDEALADYSRAIEIDSRFGSAFINRGAIWLDKGELDKALADLNRAVELNPQSTSALINRGVVWARKGKPEKALADYDKVIELDPKDAATLYNRGLVLGGRGDFDKALADFNKSIEINPRDGKTFFNRGVIWTKKNQSAKALEDMNMAIKLNFKDPYVYFVRGSLYLLFKREKEACADLEIFIRRAPNHRHVGVARSRLAQARARQR